MLIQKNIIQIDELPVDNTINNLGDDTWFVVDIRDERNVTKIHWDTVTYSDEKLVFAKEYLRNWLGGFRDDFQRLYGVPSTVTHRTRVVESILKYAEMVHPNKKLCHFSTQDIFEMMQSLVFPMGSKKTLSIGRGEILSAIIRASQEYYVKGQATDGFDCDLPNDLIDAALKQFLTNRGVNYLKWRKGGSWGGMPISVAMLLVADCLEVIRSEKTKIVLALYDDLSEHRDLLFRHIFVRNVFTRTIDKTYFDQHTGNYKYGEQFQRLKRTIEGCTGKPLSEFPFENEGDFTSYVKQVYDASLMLCMIVTGGRISEIVDILADEIEPDDNGDWWFKSPIHKTNKGLKELRAITGLAAEAVNTVIRLSLFDKEALSLPVFLFAHNADDNYVIRNNEQRVGRESTRKRLQAYYQEFLTRVGSEIAEAHPKFTPHNTRHTWVDFALRRFDGNVLEEIRSHFRHKYGSYFTRHYSDEKLSPHVNQLREREYLEEIIYRIAGEEGNEFHGSVALYIKNRIAESHHFFGDDELDSMELLVDEIADEFLRLVPHEWGYCVLRESTQSQAKCFDKDAKIPNIELGSSFENCSGCIHRLTHSSQKEDIVRIAVAHNDFINNYPLRSFQNTSELTLKRAKAMIKEIENESV